MFKQQLFMPYTGKLVYESLTICIIFKHMLQLITLNRIVQNNKLDIVEKMLDQKNVVGLRSSVEYLIWTHVYCKAVLQYSALLMFYFFYEWDQM